MLTIKVGETFVRGKEKYRLAEKKELEELVEKYKKECDKEVKTLQGKTHYDYERKKHVPIKPTQGFLVSAVREVYSDSADVKHDDSNISKALKFAKRCHEKNLNDEFVDEDLLKKYFVRVEEEGNAELLKLEKQSSCGLLNYKEY